MKARQSGLSYQNGHMKAYDTHWLTILMAGAVALLSACVPTTQIQCFHTRGDMRVSKDWGGPLSIAVRTPTLVSTQQGEIDMRASFARDGQGRRYRLMAEKVPYVESYPAASYFLQRRLWRVSGEGRPLSDWPNGDWTLHVERVFPRGRETYGAVFKLCTRGWTPLSGAPN